MTAEQIARCRQELEELRRRPANVSREEVEGLALRTGRMLRSKKGGHPRYDKDGRYPLIIPGHKILNKFTLKAILNQIEEDIDWEEERLADGI